MAGPRTTPSLLERTVDRIPFLEKELFLLRRIVGPGDVCVDVGAAGGAHLLIMARRVGPHGTVLGFEPRPGSHRALAWLVDRFGLGERVRLHAVALADDDGAQPLRVPVVPTRAHLNGSADDADEAAAFASLPHRELRVPTRTLDAVVEEEGLPRVDLVKCDVEGAELLVLAGAHRVLDEHRPVVVLEADDEHQAREGARAADVLDAVRRHGYRVFRYVRGALEEVDGPVPGEDDYVFVPRGRAPRVPVRTTTGRHRVT
jgi:FkbM family methyltransferase